jgi:serine/threonine-protein kinase
VARISDTAPARPKFEPGQAASGAIECASCAWTNASDARFCSGCGTRLAEVDADEAGESAAGGADPLLGRTVAERYRIEELLGRGGMGVVYRVEHVRIGKIMAMKLLHGALACEKDVVKRFKREAEAASKLDHPNTVQVFDFGQSEGLMYLVMEYLSGRDLGQVIKHEGPLPFARVARITAQVCASVAQAHERGIVHRDLKPENVMISESRGAPDHVKVLDFGLAKLRESDDADRSITRAGSIIGTPYYMAPEHIRGEGCDARSDVYAVGALLYKALTGVPPFWAGSAVGVLTMHLTDAVVPPSQRTPDRGIPLEADRIVLKAMAKDPADRYPTMSALHEELLGYLASIGQDAGLVDERDDSDVIRSSDSRRTRAVATRDDVDAYERRLRRRARLSYAVLAAAALGLASASAWAWTQRAEPVRSIELEPNDTPLEATLLPEGSAVRAYLGRRLDEQRSDADFYRLRGAGGRREVRLEVGAIPNMDVVVEVFRASEATPLLVANSGGVGEPETVPNFPLEGATHYLRVREVWESGRYPSENVSDAYDVRWTLLAEDAGREREVNDTVPRGEPVEPSGARSGYIGWRGDRDTYCATGSLRGYVARVSGVPGLDLALDVVDRVSGRTRTIDAEAVGLGEESGALDGSEADGPCFVVRSHDADGSRANAPDDPYRFSLDPITTDGAAEVGAPPTTGPSDTSTTPESASRQRRGR